MVLTITTELTVGSWKQFENKIWCFIIVRIVRIFKIFKGIGTDILRKILSARIVNERSNI